jgi:dipeptidyl aminopeptidase/acylaminoacyl peptidase
MLPKIIKPPALVIGLAVLFPASFAQNSDQAEREEMYRRYLEFPSYVKGGKVEPHWMADGSSFWYAEGAPANTVIWKVDPVANTKEPLFDTARLRKALARVLDHEPPYKGLPFDEFTFVDEGEGEATVKFALEGREFVLRLDNYALTTAPAPAEDVRAFQEPRIIRKGYYDYPDLYEVPSPDGRWLVGLKDHNLWLRSAYDGRGVPLTTGGVKDYEWGDLPWGFGPVWSPDSLKLAVTRRDYREAPKIPIVHFLKPMEEVQWEPYPWKAGAPIERTELYIIDILSKRPVKVEIGESPYERVYRMLGWLPDGSEFLFIETDQYYREIRLAAANPKTGAAREILSESHETYVEMRWGPPLVLLDSRDRFIWQSDRDGWSHLYLYDVDGNLIRRLTQGAFPVDRVVTVDEEAGWLYFIARVDRRRPYDTHLCRVNLDGEQFAQLTEAPGQHDLKIYSEIQHQAQFSPSKQFFLDSHSTLSRPPAVELRRADGTLLQTISKLNVDGLKELRWRPPEEFVVKAADGETDLYGVLSKPYDFDPTKKYPVIELLTQVPRTFMGRPHLDTNWHKAMAQLGFITFTVGVRVPDGARGPEFARVALGTFGRHEIPDHVAALQQLAETRPYMDLSRVGIIGGSYFGYFATRGMLQAPDTYHVGIAIAPVIDLYTHANYLALGSPESNRTEYEYSSNLHLAGNLEGKLLLIQGTADVAVPFSHTMKMVEAFIRVGKPYDLIVLPEWGHWGNERMERYWMEAARRYFEEHLRP